MTETIRLDGGATTALWGFVILTVLGVALGTYLYRLGRFPHLRRDPDFGDGEPRPWLGAVAGTVVFLGFGWLGYRDLGMRWHAVDVSADAVVFHYRLPNRTVTLPRTSVLGFRSDPGGGKLPRTTFIAVLRGRQGGHEHRSVPVLGIESAQGQIDLYQAMRHTEPAKASSGVAL